MNKLVLFFHPGSERDVVKHKDGFCPVPKDRAHTRKYIISRGKILKDNKEEEKVLGFWGEWEGPSKFTMVREILKKENHPSSLHHTLIKDYKSEDTDIKVNTDPLVMDNMFLYSNCQQNYIEDMKTLEPGDILLFGTGKKSDVSKSKRKKIYDIFICDTVFIVRYRIDNIKTNSKEEFQNSVRSYLKRHKAPKSYVDNFERLKDWYYHHSIESLEDNKYSLYIGATYEDSYKGMYSFVPCVEVDLLSHHIGFERPDISPLLKEMPCFNYVKEGLKGFGNQNVNINTVASGKKTFNLIVEFIRNQKLEIGIACDFYHEE